MNSLWTDVRYAVRMLVKSPGFSLIAVLTLALGIGANATIFSWINSTLLDPIPGVKHASQYVEIVWGSGDTAGPLSYPDLQDFSRRNHSFSSIAASELESMGIGSGDKPQRVWTVFATANYFDALGVHPVLGRGFVPADGAKPGAAAVAVISYHLWQAYFGGRSSVVGGVVQLDKHPYTVIGVAPPDFVGTQSTLREDLWIPVTMIGQFHHGEDFLQSRNVNWLIPVAHLKPGVSQEQAQADCNVVVQEIVREYPDSHKGDNAINLYPMWRAPFGGNYYIHTILFLLMAVSGLVLLLACANMANLLLVRSVGRRREMAIRLSIGATRWRLIRQLLAESMMLALLGGAIAMLFTIWTAGTLQDFIPSSGLPIPISMGVHVDRSVLLATLFISLVTGVIFGVLPAFRSSALQPVAVLKEESGSTTGGLRKARLSSILVVAQVAVSLLLLVSAGLFIRSVQLAQRFNPGFNPHNVLLYSYDLKSAGYTQPAGIEFNRQLLAKLNAIPGVDSATLASTIPFSFDIGGYSVQPEGYVPKPHESMEVENNDVSPGYFKTMQIPLVAGRTFTDSDTDKSEPVTIVNEAFARRYWPNQDAIGKWLKATGKSFTVVGVAHNSDYDNLGEQAKPFMYLPLTQDYDAGVTIELRVFGNPMAYVRPAQEAVHSLDANLPLFDLATLDSRIQLATTTQRMGGAFVGGFGLVALILAAIGIYGVLAYTTRQRTHEIGLRMALGAEPGNVFRLVLGQGARLAIIGVTIGLAAAFALTRALSSQLFNVSATDPLTYTGVALLLCAVALLACYIPARRAAKVDPMVALRYE
ncbi:MAG TPA: ABC transporter permease [Candidatus Acidoferrum sp.]|nr:ABC transporter permease [Candidatus Acidoferrum sp.]